LVKEADAFCNAGYDVIVLYNLVADWAQHLDKDIIAKAKWKFIQIGGINKADWKYQISRIRFAFYRFLNERFSVNIFAEKAHARCYSSLLKKAVKLKADWYIGHNPGAIAIVANAASKTNAKAGFDFEDYHRGEYVNNKSMACERQIFIEEKYMPMFTYISAASPLIAKAVSYDFPKSKEVMFNIFNTFPGKHQPSFKTNNENGLSLLWFSQNVGRDRGLEQIVRVLKVMNDKSIELVLLGNYTEALKFYFLNLAGEMAHNIIFAGILSPDKLIETCSTFDIGFATELSTPINRDICLTNKIFTYLVAGNAIILSNTSAQTSFNNEYKVGLVFNNDKELEESIIFYKNKENLLTQRKYNYQLAKEKLNWENESQKLLALIN
jgi:glycosyltransferase involved in cell wall biosynthesis